MATLNVNCNAVYHYTKKLEKLHRSAFPTAVRGALNKAATDVKQRTMPAQADRVFTKRRENFFKANSRVDFATGFNMATMQSVIGFKPLSGTNHAVDDLEQQEHGGKIGGRAFVPLRAARGGSYKKNVRPAARISTVRQKLVDALNNKKGRNAKEKFIRSAIHAGKGGFVIGDREKDGARVVFQVRSLKKIKRHMRVKSIAMHSVKGGRKVMPKATHFMEKASRVSANKMDRYYNEEARRQLRKFTGRIE